MQEIKSAYRKLAHQYHPDKNEGDQYASSQFEIVKEAYEVLTDPSKKDLYLQQRWYFQSTGRKRTETAITPVTVLKRALELDRYVSTLDVHRMDQEGLYGYIQDLLSPDTIGRVNAFKETSINDSIVEAILKAARPLHLPYAKKVADHLETLEVSEHTKKNIADYLTYAHTSQRWDKYRVWVILAAVLSICLLIYFISR